MFGLCTDPPGALGYHVFLHLESYCRQPRSQQLYAMTSSSTNDIELVAADSLSDQKPTSSTNASGEARCVILPFQPVPCDPIKSVSERLVENQFPYWRIFRSTTINAQSEPGVDENHEAEHGHGDTAHHVRNTEYVTFLFPHWNIHISFLFLHWTFRHSDSISESVSVSFSDHPRSQTMENPHMYRQMALFIMHVYVWMVYRMRSHCILNSRTSPIYHWRSILYSG